MTTIILLIISEGLARGLSWKGVKRGKSRWHTLTWDMMGAKNAANHFFFQNITFKTLSILARYIYAFDSCLVIYKPAKSFPDRNKGAEFQTAA